MNCRAMARIMPELAAGELDEQRSAEAREHIAACDSCAEELRRYEAALGALATPHKMAEVPKSLDVLRLPEATRRPWLRPALASVGAAILLLAAVLTLPLFFNEKPQTHLNTIVEQIPPKPRIIKPEPAPPEPARQQVAQQPRHRHRVVRKQYQAKKPEEPETPATPEIVIVSQAGLPSGSYVIEIESTDTASGITSVYSQLHDKAAGNHSFEMQSTTNVADDGRT